MSAPAHRLLRSVATAVAAAALAAAALTSPARSAPPPAGAPTSAAVVMTSGAAQRGYDTAIVRVGHGGRLSVVNLDAVEHTVTAEGRDSSGQPLFRVYAEPGRTTLVPGVERLAPGSYRFYCQFHPAMRGTLVVDGKGDGVRPVPTRFEQPLVVPRPLRGRHIVLTMRESAVRVLPRGPLTRMWTFNGSYPGPTLVLAAGRRSDVTVVDRLPAAAGAFSLHLHGDHHPSPSDGQPMALPLTRTRPRTYTLPLTDGGRPEPAAFDWYHDHRMGVTTRNNWRGLQGMALVTDSSAGRLGLPGGRFAIPLMLSERTFTADNQLTDPFARSRGGHPHGAGAAAPPDDATIGERVLVNGRVAPFANVAARRYRLLLVNTSPFSSYDLELSDGRPFVQVGTGNGLLPRPVVRQHVLLGPAQRVDVVVDLGDAARRRVVLRSVPRIDRPDRGVGTVAADLLELRVGATAADPSKVPSALVPMRALPSPRAVAKVWTVGLTGRGRTRSWTLDGRPFDPRVTGHRVRLGSVQVWELRNPTSVTHYVHVHEEQWRTLLRDGRPPPPWERGLEDTWRLDPGESVRIAARFTDHAGPFMIHCHMLDHEDHGLMAQFLVVR